MNWGSPEFVIVIVSISTVGWIINNWIRAKHGYSLDDEWGDHSEHGNHNGHTETKRLEAENKQLHSKLDAMQDRMIVLEKIVTDRGYSLSDEIEALRDVPSPVASDNGTPLNLDRKEKA